MKHTLLLAALTALSALPLTAQTLTEWDNTAITSLHRLPAHELTLPCDNPMLARSLNMSKSQNWLSLNGTWQFHWSPTPDGVPQHFYKPSFNTHDWDTITVPSCWQVYGVHHGKNWDKPLYVNVRYPFTYNPNTYSVMADRPSHFSYNNEMINPVGCYRRTFTIDKTWLSQRAILRFNGAGHGYYVWLNGKFIGYAEDSYLPSEFDVTPALQKGENTLAVQVMRFTSGSFLECQDYWRLTGITRDVMLYTTPQQYIADYFFQTKALTQLNNTATATIDIQLAGPNLQGCTIETSLKDGARSLFHTQDAAPAAGGWLNISTPEIKNIEPWSAENPKTYDLVISLKRGAKNIDTRACRVGFRTVSIRPDGALLINGNPIKLHGVNRHGFSQDGGRTCTREDIRADLMEMKRLNVNAIRTSHYPNNPYFYELADSLGFYVLAEANVECHGNTGLSKVEAFKHAMVERNTRHVLTFRNHPCIFGWSFGNESGGGENFKAVAEAIETLDNSRITHYEGNSQWCKVTSTMYAHRDRIQQIGQQRQDAYTKGELQQPHIQCENTHAMGNAMANQREYYNLYEQYPALAGEFVWDWKDQGLRVPIAAAGKPAQPIKGRPVNEQPAIISVGQPITNGLPTVETHGNASPAPETNYFWAYGGDFNDQPNDGTFCTNGVVLPNVQPTAKSFNMKHLYQPLVIQAINAQKGTFIAKSKLQQVPFQGYQTTCEILQDGAPVKQIEVSLPAIAPGDSTQFDIDLSDINILPTSEYIAIFTTTLAKPTLWAPAGHTVAQDEAVIATRSKPNCYSHPTKGEASAKDITLEFTDGIFSGLTYKKQPLISTTPHLCLFRAPTENDKNQAGNWDNLDLRNLKPTKIAYSEQRDYHETTATYEYRTSSGFVVMVDYFYRSYDDHSIYISAVCRPSTPGIVLPKFGFRLEMPEQFNQLTWYGRGPWDSYPDRCDAPLLGIHHSTVEEQWTNYVMPQEMGNKQDVRWLAVTNKDGEGLLFSAPTPMATTVANWRAEDIYTNRGDRIKHPHQMKWANSTVVSLDAWTRALGNATCGPDVLPEYERQLPEQVMFSVFIRPLKTSLSDSELTAIGCQAAPICQPVQIETDATSQAILSCTTPGAAISYRIDGAEWQAYTTPINMKNGGKLEAIAKVENMTQSQISTKMFDMFVNRSQWTILSCSSEQGGNEVATNLFDGNPNTIWHSRYGKGESAFPHEIVIDMQQPQNVQSVLFQGRSDGQNGRVQHYEVYLSNDPKVWTRPAAEGRLNNNASPQKVKVDGGQYRYLKFVARSNYGRDNFASMAEIYIGVLASTQTAPAQNIKPFDCTKQYRLKHLESGLYLHRTAPTHEGSICLDKLDKADHSFLFGFEPIEGYTALYSAMAGGEYITFDPKASWRILTSASPANALQRSVQILQKTDNQAILRSTWQIAKNWNFDSHTHGSYVYSDKPAPATFLLEVVE